MVTDGSAFLLKSEITYRSEHSFRMVRLRSSTLNLFAYALVTAALLFSLYSGYRVSFPSSTSSTGQEKVAGSRVLLRDTGLQSGGTIEAPSSSNSPCPRAVPSRSRILSTAAIVHSPRRYHVLTTCQGFSNHWQIRIHYYWYVYIRSCMAALWIYVTYPLKVKSMP